ncbi:hypothetical protein F4782DRAFT_259595 [Xylaria castorea]|nr:hypothetical protein F4782DRAFT_259595 [Xylaria castorea]
MLARSVTCGSEYSSHKMKKGLVATRAMRKQPTKEVRLKPISSRLRSATTLYALRRSNSTSSCCTSAADAPALLGADWLAILAALLTSKLFKNPYCLDMTWVSHSTCVRLTCGIMRAIHKLYIGWAGEQGSRRRTRKEDTHVERKPKIHFYVWALYE